MVITLVSGFTESHSAYGIGLSASVDGTAPVAQDRQAPVSWFAGYCTAPSTQGASRGASPRRLTKHAVTYIESLFFISTVLNAFSFVHLQTWPTSPHPLSADNFLQRIIEHRTRMVAQTTPHNDLEPNPKGPATTTAEAKANKSPYLCLSSLKLVQLPEGWCETYASFP